MVVNNTQRRRIRVTSGDGAVAIVSSFENAWKLSMQWVTPVRCKVIS